MNIKETKELENSMVELTVEVTGDEFKNAVDAAFRKNLKKMNVPGFRRGKAPRKVVERLYGEGVFYDDAINALYPSAYDDAVKESKISPVDRPEVEVESVDANGFVFKAKVTVKPKVEVENYKGIKVTRNVYNVTDADVDKEIEARRRQNQRMVDVDRPAADKDSVNINFEGFVDGKAFDGGKAENFDLVLGSGSFIPGFEDQIVGKAKGDEFDVNVTFPDDYHVDDLKGKPAVFKVKLNDIKQIELPDVDDEFVKDVSEFDTLDEYKKDIKDRLTKEKERQSESELDGEIIERLLENTKVDIPQVMIDNKANSMLSEFEQRLAGSGLNLKTYLSYTGMDEAAMKKSYEAEAAKQVKVRLALEKVVELEKIVIDQKDIDDEYQKIADAYKMPLDQVKLYIPEQDITMDVAVGKAVELIKANADITDKKPEQKAAKPKTAAKKPAAKKTTTAKKPAAKKAEPKE